KPGALEPSCLQGDVGECPVVVDAGCGSRVRVSASVQGMAEDQSEHQPGTSDNHANENSRAEVKTHSSDPSPASLCRASLAALARPCSPTKVCSDRRCLFDGRRAGSTGDLVG